jgi:DNA-binding transcriptional ArsR family regulator
MENLETDLRSVPLEKILYALSDETRLKIIAIIDEEGGEMPCGSFAERTGVTKPTLSHHFAILRETGVISTRMEGNQKFNTLRKKEMSRHFPGLLELVLKTVRKNKKKGERNSPLGKKST